VDGGEYFVEDLLYGFLGEVVGAVENCVLQVLLQGSRSLERDLLDVFLLEIPSNTHGK
jgi:hypothetical protein